MAAATRRPGRRARTRRRRSGRAAAGWQSSRRSYAGRRCAGTPAAAGRRGSRCARRPRWSARRARGRRGRPARRGPARGAAAGRRRSRGPASSTSSSSPSTRASRTSSARCDMDRRPEVVVVGGRGPRGRARRAGRRRTGAAPPRRPSPADVRSRAAGPASGTPPRLTRSSSVSRPSRCAIAAESSGSALTSAGHRARLDGEAGERVGQRRPAAGARRRRRAGRRSRGRCRGRR